MKIEDLMGPMLFAVVILWGAVLVLSVTGSHGVPHRCVNGVAYTTDEGKMEDSP